VTDVTTRPVSLAWPHDLRYRPVGRLVLGGVAARLDMPVDRIDELGLALDSLAHASVVDDRLELEIEVAPAALRATVGRFVVDPLADPSTKRVVERLADEVVSTTHPDGYRVVLSVAVGINTAE
jgi:hypothetical protein